jgi:hypothetical protein
VKRRVFITALAGVTAWPLAGHAQQQERLRRVGVLMLWRETDPLEQKSRTAFEHALGRFGWVEGRNIRIDYCLPPQGLVLGRRTRITALTS